MEHAKGMEWRWTYSKHNGMQLEDYNQGKAWITYFKGLFGCCEEAS